MQIVRGLPDALYATEKNCVISNYPKDSNELKEKLLAMEAGMLASSRRTEPDTATALFAGRGGPKFGRYNCGGNWPGTATKAVHRHLQVPARYARLVGRVRRVMNQLYVVAGAEKPGTLKIRASRKSKISQKARKALRGSRT